MRRPSLLAPLAVAIGIALFAPIIASAQTGGPYSLSWSSIASGGAMFSTSLSPAFSLGGTIGQSSAGPYTGGSYLVIGGLWGYGGGAVADVPGTLPQLPTAFRVFPSAPNPFSIATTVAFDLPVDQRVTMEVFNLRGQRVRVLLDELMPAGRHSMTWAGVGDDGQLMAPGVYWIRTLVNHHHDVRKIVLLK